MSRTSTSSAPQTGKTAQAAATPAATQACLPQEKVAMRAYQKWLQSGCKHGCDKQNWFEAEAEIKAELARTGSTQARR